MSEDAKSNLLAGLDKALLIALATPLAYLFAFQYDRGYLNFFGVPDVLVDVSLRDLLIAAVTVASVSYTLYMVWDGILVILPEGWPRRIRRRAIWLLAITIAFVFLRNLFDWAGRVFVGGVVLIALLFFFFVVLPIARKNHKPIEDANQPRRPDAYAHKGVLPAMVRSGIDPRLIMAALIVVAVSYVSDLVGDAKARMQTSFLVYQSGSGPPCAVIRMRDSDLICADFNPDARQLLGDYRFLKSEGAMLSLRKTGRLQDPDLTKEMPQSSKANGTAESHTTP